MARRLLMMLTAVAALGVLGAAPAGAIADNAHGGTQSHGVGFCFVYLTPDPEEGTEGEVPFDRLGKAIRESARDAGVPAVLADLRYPSCGGPSAVE
ncbi:MAG TPA: hypothetical protein VFZ83_12720 [Acidimicrobiia bacterium]|nr:hypothetical protein [Acidimicrobiia bacterium]